MSILTITAVCLGCLPAMLLWPNLYCQVLSDTSECAETSKWTRLTEINGEWVLYKYCFAGLATVELTKTDEGGMKLIIFSGQDSEIYDVINMRRNGDTCRLKLKCPYAESKETKEISFQFLDASGRFAGWDLGGSDGCSRYILSGCESEVPVLYENNGDCGEP